MKIRTRQFVSPIIFLTIFSLAFCALRANAAILVSDFNNQEILEFDDSGNLLGTWADADFPTSGLTGARDIAFDSGGNLYVAHFGGGFSAVRKYDVDGNFLGVFTTVSGAHDGLAIDSADNVYLTTGSTAFNAQLRKYDSSGTALGSIATLPSGRSDIAIDDNDILYVIQNIGGLTTTDTEIHRYNTSGSLLGVFGQANLTDSGLFKASGLTLDAAGNLFVISDGASNAGKILKYDSVGTYLGIFADGALHPGAGPAKNPVFDGDGFLYATDSLEDDVLKYDASGNLVGRIIEAGIGGVAATFRPEGVAFLQPEAPPLFTDSGQALGSGNSQSLALGDVDADGDLDAFTGSGIFSPNKVWLNDGGGVFTDSGQALGSGSSLGVALADFDHDGDLDAFVANGNGSTATGAENDQVWLNDGTGLFSSGQTLPSFPSFSLAIGDVTGDGELDAVTGNISGSTEKIWVGNGDGTFTLGAFQFPNQGTVESVGLADIDGDGDLDVVFGTFGFGTSIWRNNGNGTFTDTGHSATGVHSVALGDIDDDGDQDLIVAERSFAANQENRVWTNDGTGAFVDSAQALGDSNSFRVARGDLDGDVDLDLFIANNADPDKVWLNDSLGGFSDSTLELALGNSVAVALGDVDGDGDNDALVADNSGPDKVWINNSSGASSDVDRDAVPDLIDPCPTDPFDGCDLMASTAGVIGPGGGNLTTEDESVEVVVPAGALPVETTLTVTDQGSEFIFSTAVGASQSVFGVNIGPDGTVFTNPVTLTFSWDDTDDDGIVDSTNFAESDLFITKDGTQITDSCSMDPGCNQAVNEFEFTVIALSDFTLSGPLDSDGDGIPDDYDDVQDACPNENSYGFDVNADGCIDSIAGLTQLVTSLVIQSVIDANMENSLLSKLDNAQKSQDKNNICALVNQLEAFQAQVMAQTGKKISVEATDEVIAYAESVIAFVLFALGPDESC